MPFEINGMEAEIAKFQMLADASEEKCKRAVKAGAKHVVECLKQAVPYLDGHTEGGITAGPVKYSAALGYYCDIEIKGKDPKTGESLAKIGNILEYGRSNMKAQPWFAVTIRREESATILIMAEEFDKEG